jgi:hypothetical protein
MLCPWPTQIDQIGHEYIGAVEDALNAVEKHTKCQLDGFRKLKVEVLDLYQ